jgi:hypothetical protein
MLRFRLSLTVIVPLFFGLGCSKGPNEGADSKPLPADKIVPVNQELSGVKPLPTDLAWVPADAAGFVRLAPLALWDSTELKPIRDLLSKAQPEALQALQKCLSLNPADLERLTLIMPTAEAFTNPFPSGRPLARSAITVVHLRKPYDKTQVLKVLAPQARTKELKGKTYYFDENKWTGLFLADDRTILFGSDDAILWLLERAGPQAGLHPLKEALQRATGKNHLVVGLNGKVLFKELDPALLMFLGEADPLRHSQSGTITVDLEKGLSAEVRLTFASEAAAQKGEKGAQAFLKIALQSLDAQIDASRKRLAADKGDVLMVTGDVVGLAFFRNLRDTVKAAPVERKEAVVRVPFHLDNGGTNLVLTSLVVVPMLGTNAEKTFTSVGTTVGSTGGDPNSLPPDNLKQLAGALDRYHKDKGAFPPAAIHSKDGKPLLSWRVALLPYVGQEALYKKFKLDEPWDSLHNRKLLLEMPKVFGETFSMPGEWKTRFQAFVGPGAVFQGKEPVSRDDIKDGLDATLLLVETDYMVKTPWTRPGDLPFTAKGPLPKLRGEFTFPDGLFRALFADGTVRMLSFNTPENLLRAYITYNGGEKVSPPK